MYIYIIIFILFFELTRSAREMKYGLQVVPDLCLSLKLEFVVSN